MFAAKKKQDLATNTKRERKKERKKKKKKKKKRKTFQNYKQHI